MRLTVLFLLALTLVSAAEKHTITQDQLNDLTFVTSMLYNMYNGFIRGFYRETKQNVIDERCLGAWVQTNLTHLDGVMTKLFNMEFNIPYDEAVEAATDMVNLIYKNREYCQMDKVASDFYELVMEDDILTDQQLFDNIKNNIFQIGVRIEKVWEIIVNDDLDSDDSILKMCDTFFETYGALISYILGFDKTFDGKAHKYRFALSESIHKIKLPKLFN